jgi:hypothetical protein
MIAVKETKDVKRRTLLQLANVYLDSIRWNGALNPNDQSNTLVRSFAAGRMAKSLPDAGIETQASGPDMLDGSRRPQHGIVVFHAFCAATTTRASRRKIIPSG